MNQQEFKRLTDTCDKILDRFSSDNHIVAIPWLHVLNGHPNSISQYDHVFERRRFSSAAALFLHNTRYIFLKLLQSLATFKTNHTTNEPGKADVLFISHLVSVTALRNNSDFYFGTLPLNSKKATGQVAAIGLIDHTPSQKSVDIRNEIEKSEPRKILFLKTRSFASEFRFAWKCFSSFAKLIRAAVNEEDAIVKNIYREAALFAMAPETLAALRIQDSIRRSLVQTNATILVITWEGRSWERLAIQAARSLDRSIRCLAYQHTVLLESTHALIRSMGKPYDPDNIFTIGKKTADTIKHKETFKDTDITSYGSYRLSVSPTVNPGRTGNVLQCLVTPEGIESECVLLFDFAINLAEKSAGMNFIFRMHPVLPYKMLVQKYPRFAKLPANCNVSDLSDINDDFKRTDLLLYRGSSVCMYATMQGLRPVYYALPDEISIDPLYQLGEWRIKIQNEKDFTEAVSIHKETPADVKNEMYLSARTYCEAYLQLPDENNFYHKILLKK